MATSTLPTIKITLTGISQSGKTCFLNKLKDPKYALRKEDPTIGVDFGISSNDSAKLLIRDASGHERFESIVATYYRDAKIILFFIDCTQNIDMQIKYLKHMNRYAPPTSQYLPILIFSKSDKSQPTQALIDNIKLELDIKEHHVCSVANEENEENIDAIRDDLFQKAQNIATPPAARNPARNDSSPSSESIFEQALQAVNNGPALRRGTYTEKPGREFAKWLERLETDTGNFFYTPEERLAYANAALLLAKSVGSAASTLKDDIKTFQDTVSKLPKRHVRTGYIIGALVGAAAAVLATLTVGAAAGVVTFGAVGYGFSMFMKKWLDPAHHMAVEAANVANALKASQPVR